MQVVVTHLNDIANSSDAQSPSNEIVAREIEFRDVLVQKSGQGVRVVLEQESCDSISQAQVADRGIVFQVRAKADDVRASNWRSDRKSVEGVGVKLLRHRVLA